ncbi:hypothetical protein SeMB42_g02920 [Synchytrium endobioticum]|uniref:PNPLA domain-containing protein n=1 Tax=Synchytrium endobioticum TaxID=286115 RepID=A0A507CPE1_9FUNG|nr:hypothetical protein SeLEV6574_g06296 [Synchytrium endobioticum]TPX48666.1 hypothetical protein SeMB42_g02920 [Synchytrium endobioticum]
MTTDPSSCSWPTLACWLPTFVLYQTATSLSREESVREQLRSAHTYEEWKEAAQKLDVLQGYNKWALIPESKEYDHRLIAIRLHVLQESRARHDVEAMIYYLRSGLLRNLGGLCDARLFSRSYLGTKKLIEDYLDEVVAQIEYIRDNDFPGILTPQTKLDFLSDTKQAFGATVLLLEGGASFGLYHLGVVKALSEHGLLPRVISGSSIGALIAAMVCVHNDEDLPAVFEPGGIDLRAFSRKGRKGNFRRKLIRLLKHGYLMDVKVLEECVRANVGDLTFEEAYKRTRRVLNICVSTTRTNEVPRLLNYLTAPNVLIWSAACCSTAVTGLYDNVDLMAKNKDGEIYKFSPSTIKWNVSSVTGDTLSDLFNVNHFILSQANPHLTAANRKGPKAVEEGTLGKFFMLIVSEIRYRLCQLLSLGLLPSVLHALLDSRSIGHITITPSISLSDLFGLFSNPTYASLQYWVKNGEQSTWPYISFIRNRTKIEFAFEQALLKLKAPDADKLSRDAETLDGKQPKSRTKTIH